MIINQSEISSIISPMEILTNICLPIIWIYTSIISAFKQKASSIYGMWNKIKVAIIININNSNIIKQRNISGVNITFIRIVPFWNIYTLISYIGKLTVTIEFYKYKVDFKLYQWHYKTEHFVSYLLSLNIIL